MNANKKIPFRVYVKYNVCDQRESVKFTMLSSGKLTKNKFQVDFKIFKESIKNLRLIWINS